MSNARSLQYFFQKLSPSKKIELLFPIVVIGLIFSFAFHQYWTFFPQWDKYPYNTLLFDPIDRYMDFLNILLPFQAKENPYSWFGAVYFPATYIPLWLFKNLHPQIAINLYLIGFIFGLGLLIRNTTHSFSRQNRLMIFGIALSSYPVLFTLDRGNLEAWVFLFSASALLIKPRKSKISPLVLTLAGCMKLYPFLYFFPDLFKRRWKKLFIVTIFAFILTGVGLLLVGGPWSTTTDLLLRNLGIFDSMYIRGRYGLHHNLSLFTQVRILILYGALKWNPALYPYEQVWLDNWKAFSAIAFTGLGYLTWKLRNAAPWKPLFIVIAAQILLMPVSFDYKLIHVLIPLLLFLKSPAEKGDCLTVWIFGLLLIPKDYFYLNGDCSIAVILNPLILLLMIKWIYGTEVYLKRASNLEIALAN